jgi:hypothetical protein
MSMKQLVVTGGSRARAMISRVMSRDIAVKLNSAAGKDIFSEGTDVVEVVQQLSGLSAGQRIAVLGTLLSATGGAGFGLYEVYEDYARTNSMYAAVNESFDALKDRKQEAAVAAQAQPVQSGAAPASAGETNLGTFDDIPASQIEKARAVIDEAERIWGSRKRLEILVAYLNLPDRTYDAVKFFDDSRKAI